LVTNANNSAIWAATKKINCSSQRQRALPCFPVYVATNGSTEVLWKGINLDCAGLWRLELLLWLL